MIWIAEQWRRLVYLVRRRRIEEDLREEMRLHLEMRAAERAEEGVAPDEAAYAAQRRFGNVTRLREKSRDAWGWGWLDSILQDVRYGVRALAANPGFTLTAVLSLVLGIGANTAIFSILNAVMLRSLPVEDPQRLVKIQSDGNENFTNPIWEQVRDHQRVFSGTLAYGAARFDLTEGGESHYASGMWVSGDFFRVLGVAPLRGRMITVEDDQHGGGKYGPVAVISYGFWQSHFGGDPEIVGKPVKLDRHQFEIIGVTPPWFTGLNVDHGFDVAIPVGCEPILHTDMSALDQRGWWWLHILGRLGPGSSIQQAEAGMKALAPEIYRATLPSNWEARFKEEYMRRSFALLPASTGFSETGQRYRKALFTLMAVVGLVLLIACANIANLLLAGAAARQREISIRMAIGAGRRRVIRQLLTESLMLSLLGAAGGLLFARWGGSLLLRLLSTSQEALEMDLAPDLRLLAFTMGMAILTGVLFGIAPAFRATNITTSQVLKENARGATFGSSRFRLGKALVAGQVALSLVLLVGAGLFLGTIRNLLTIDAGFDRHNVLLVNVDTLARVPKEQRLGLYRAILDRLREVPGVMSAANCVQTPISGNFWNDIAYPEGYQSNSIEDTLTYFNRVSPDYFRTLGTPLVMGRDFSSRDTLGSSKVMIINEAAARHYFGASSPIGKTIALGVMDRPGERESYEVIGVVKDAKYGELREETLRTGFVASAQDKDLWPKTSYAIRVSGSIDSVIPFVRKAISGVNSGVSLEFRSFEAQVNESLQQQKIVALLTSFFGALALLLAMIGLYGVTAYAVARRQGEIGIRMALGAQQGSVIWLVLRDVVLMLGAGSAAGVAIALAAGRLVESLLYGVKPADATTLVMATIVLAAATAIAGYLPALRASRLDPTAALREE